MRKSFWEVFRQVFLNIFVRPAPIAFVIMLMIYYYHPYEQCKRMYEDPDDIMECVWILEND